MTTPHRLILGSSAEDIAAKVEAYTKTLPPEKQAIHTINIDFLMDVSWHGADDLLRFEFMKSAAKPVVFDQFDRVLDDYKKTYRNKKDLRPSNTILHNIAHHLSRKEDAVIILTAHQDQYDALFNTNKPEVWKQIKEKIVIEGAPPATPKQTLFDAVRRIFK